MKKPMKKSNIVRTSAIVGGVSLATILGSSAATVLTGGSPASNNQLVTAEGSNAVGTPNIALAWSSTQQWDTYTSRTSSTKMPFTNWPNDPAANGVYQMDKASPNNSYTIAFTPDAGFNVALMSTDFNAWTDGGSFVIDWVVSGATSGSLGSGDNVAIAADGVTNLNFGALTGAGSEVVTLTLTMDATSTGTGSYIAMDNLSFDQVASVPEPSSSLLAVVGLGAMAMRRRRK